MLSPANLSDWRRPLVLNRSALLLSAIDMASGQPREEVERTLRLAQDVRLRKVWRFLLSQKRHTDGYRNVVFQYPVKNPKSHRWGKIGKIVPESWPVAVRAQQGAIASLFWGIVALNREVGRATEVRFDPTDPEWQSMRAFASSGSKKSELYLYTPPFLREEARRDLHEIAATGKAASKDLKAIVIATLSQQIYRYFGFYLYGQVATIASVVLGAPVTASDVRENWRDPHREQYLRGMGKHLAKIS